MPLRQQPYVPHDWYAYPRQPTHSFDNLLAAFHLHSLHVAVLDEQHGIAERILRRDLVRSERHVGYEQGSCCSAGDGAGGMYHFLQSRLGCGIITKADLSERVSD